MASLTELSFNWTGFISAMISNISFTYRSIYSKKAMVQLTLHPYICSPICPIHLQKTYLFFADWHGQHKCVCIHINHCSICLYSSCNSCKYFARIVVKRKLSLLTLFFLLNHHILLAELRVQLGYWWQRLSASIISSLYLGSLETYANINHTFEPLISSSAMDLCPN